MAILVTRPDRLAAARSLLADELATFDAACSRFRDDSELAAVNGAGGRPCQVGPLLAAALGVALRAARLTGGDVDPTVGAALSAWGYDRDFAAVAAGDGAAGRGQPPQAPDWSQISFDADRGIVQLPPGVTLDLGATAKALAADRIAERAARAYGCGVLVSLGGDLSVAGEPPTAGWVVRVTDDHAAGPGAPGQTVTVRAGGLATSSTTVRSWWQEGKRMHHIIDPSTGDVAAPYWRTVSVVAGSCVDANTASTAAVIRGQRAAAWLAECGLPARLVGVAGDVAYVCGWPVPTAAAGAKSPR